MGPTDCSRFPLESCHLVAREFPGVVAHPLPLEVVVPLLPQETPMVSAGIIERKLRRTKVRLFTVPCCSIILFSSEGMKKNVSDLPPNFFRRSIILVGALLFYNSVFPHFSHISHFRSIINFPRAPFYN